LPRTDWQADLSLQSPHSSCFIILYIYMINDPLSLPQLLPSLFLKLSSYYYLKWPHSLLHILLYTPPDYNVNIWILGCALSDFWLWNLSQELHLAFGCRVTVSWRSD
jgi:hypothetical protein